MPHRWQSHLLLVSILMSMPTPSAAQAGRPAVEAPNSADIPQPVPGEVSLAGSDRPDISRFLNVRRAVAPSLSPDGRHLAFRTQISGTPQLWVVPTDGGWPRQLTFGESVTFHAWSPAGDWIACGTDRGGNEREGFYLITPDGFLRGVVQPGRPDDRAFFEELSPLRHVRNVRAPVMLVHGANDPRDPVTESDQFVRGTRETSGEVEYLRFPDEGHGIRKLANRVIAYRRIAAFLERTLGVGLVP